MSDKVMVFDHIAGKAEAIPAEEFWHSYGRYTSDRDKWIRAFNRLEAAITHHKRAEGFPDSHDEALYHARDQILRDLHQP